jgi:hypothetical protein
MLPVTVWGKHGANWTMTGSALTEQTAIDGLRGKLTRALLSRQLDGRAHKALRKRHRGYGSYLPDWLDEGIVGLLESKAGQMEQLEMERKLLSLPTPLEKLFQETHPNAGVNTEGFDVVLTIGRFPIQAKSVCAYLHEVFGDAGLRYVVESVLKGRTANQWIPGLEKHRKEPRGKKERRLRKVADLEKAWKAWHAKR